MFRKAAGIKYPKACADSGDLSAADPEKKKAMYLFNCAQRAHGNKQATAEECRWYFDADTLLNR